jgi:hypothetical protein
MLRPERCPRAIARAIARYLWLLALIPLCLGKTGSGHAKHGWCSPSLSWCLGRLPDRDVPLGPFQGCPW